MSFLVHAPKDLQLVIGGCINGSAGSGGSNNSDSTGRSTCQPDIVNSVAMLSALGDLAVQSGFDWVEFNNASHVVGAHIGVAAIPDSCVAKLDLMFVLDGSASITAAGYASEQKFVASLIDFFEIGPEATQVGMISYSQPTRLDFDFKQWNSTESLQKAILSATYQNGQGTYTHNAMNLASAQFESVGSRIGTDHVAKVCVILTDGASGVAPPIIAAAANRLKQLDVNVFTIGLGAQFKPTELQAIASEPVDAHFFKLAVVSDIESFASAMALYACYEPASIRPCDTSTVEMEADEVRYFQLKPACTSVVTDDLVLEASALSGTSASIFVSTTNKTPSPFNYDHELHVSGNDPQRIVLSSVASGALYVGVWASGCKNGSHTAGAANVKFVIRADLFPGELNAFAVAREHQSSGLEVYTPPSPKFTANFSVSANVQYSLQDNTPNAGSTFPFAINATSGTIYTTAPLEFDAQQYWNVHINANVTDDQLESKCICGKQAVRIGIDPDSTSPTSTETSTQTSTPITTTTTTTTTATPSTTTTTTTATSSTTTTTTLASQIILTVQSKARPLDAIVAVIVATLLLLMICGAIVRKRQTQKHSEMELQVPDTFLNPVAAAFTAPSPTQISSPPFATATTPIPAPTRSQPLAALKLPESKHEREHEQARQVPDVPALPSRVGRRSLLESLAAIGQPTYTAPPPRERRLVADGRAIRGLPNSPPMDTLAPTQSTRAASQPVITSISCEIRSPPLVVQRRKWCATTDCNAIATAEGLCEKHDQEKKRISGLVNSARSKQRGVFTLAKPLRSTKGKMRWSLEGAADDSQPLCI